MEKKQKILIVEDDKDIVEVIKVRLMKEGYQSVEAYDGDEGMEKAKIEKPDLILLDIMLPKRNGFEVCRRLRQDENLKKTPIIMLTAKAQESDKLWGKEQGADVYITKPFDFSDLMDHIHQLTNMKS